MSDPEVDQNKPRSGLEQLVRLGLDELDRFPFFRRTFLEIFLTRRRLPPIQKWAFEIFAFPITVGVLATAVIVALASSGGVQRAPGTSILEILSKILPRKFHKAVIEPTVSDMQDEYIDALAAGHKWHRRWIWWRGHFSVLLALLVGAKVGIIKKFVDVWKVL